MNIDKFTFSRADCVEWIKRYEILWNNVKLDSVEHYIQTYVFFTYLIKFSEINFNIKNNYE